MRVVEAGAEVKFKDIAFGGAFRYRLGSSLMTLMRVDTSTDCRVHMNYAAVNLSDGSIGSWDPDLLVTPLEAEVTCVAQRAPGVK